jgi:predicted RNase H-like HicB family nuclease
MATSYRIILTWSPDDQAYLAEVPELPGCIADGASEQEALRNAERMIRDWIETAEALGREIPKPS